MKQDFYSLRQFLNTYLHEDWKDHSASIEEATRQFSRENPREVIEPVITDLRLITSGTFSDDELEVIVYERLSCACDLGKGGAVRANLEKITSVMQQTLSD
jgi:hypothetical protein